MATKRDLAIKIAQKTGIGVEKVSEVLEVLGESIAEVLKEGIGERRLHIPGLGTWILKEDKRTKTGKKLVFKEAKSFALNLEEEREVRVA